MIRSLIQQSSFCIKRARAKSKDYSPQFFSGLTAYVQSTMKTGNLATLMFIAAASLLVEGMEIAIVYKNQSII